MLFRNLKLEKKILVLIGAIGLIGLAGTIFSTLKIVEIRTQYSDLVHNASAGALLLAKASSSLIDTDQAIYALLMAATDESNLRAKNQKDEATKHFVGYMDTAAEKLPEKTAAIKELVSKTEIALQQTCNRALQLGATSTSAEENAKAEAEYLASCQPAISPIIESINQLAKDTHEESKAKGDQIDVMADQASLTVIIVMLFGIFGVSILAVFLTRKLIAAPLQNIVIGLTKIAQNELTVDVQGTDRADEIGIMGRAFVDLKASLIKGRELEAQQKATQEKQLERAQTIEVAVKEFEAEIAAFVTTLSSSAAQLEATSQTLTANATETNAQATSVAAGAEEASANVQTVASSAEELSASIAEISERVSSASREADVATTQAQKTGTTMNALSDNATKIGSVVELVQQIAGQTNLLALNATIEAARAGEAGKGFAVVASEVKNLANQTAKATEEISAQINGIQQSTGNAQREIETITATIVRINSLMGSVAAAVEEQRAATQEIARSVNEAARGTADVSSNTVGITTASSETGRMANDTFQAATNLSHQAEILKSKVGAFITRVKAV